MSDKPFKLPPEDKERVGRLVQEIFVPQLQQALEAARPLAPFPEVLSASASAYISMLDMTVGREAAIGLLKSMAAHLESRPVKTAQA
jgi:hypothetical protein